MNQVVTIKGISEAAGVTIRCFVRKWRNRYKIQGVEGLKGAPRSG